MLAFRLFGYMTIHLPALSQQLPSFSQLTEGGMGRYCQAEIRCLFPRTRCSFKWVRSLEVGSVRWCLGVPSYPLVYPDLSWSNQPGSVRQELMVAKTACVAQCSATSEPRASCGWANKFISGRSRISLLESCAGQLSSMACAQGCTHTAVLSYKPVSKACCLALG